MDQSDDELCRSIGPFEVLREIAKGTFGSRPESARRQEAEAWAKAEFAALESDASLRRDAREARTLAIVEEANAIAEEANKSSERANEIAASALVISRRANKSAITAAVLAAAATIIAAVIGVMYVAPK